MEIDTRLPAAAAPASAAAVVWLAHLKSYQVGGCCVAASRLRK